MSQPQIQPGIYRHYKGNLYQVLGLVRHSETEEWLVLYKTLYGDFSSWVRPFAMFTGTVNTDNGEQPRFALQQPLKAGAALPPQYEPDASRRPPSLRRRKPALFSRCMNTSTTRRPNPTVKKPPLRWGWTQPACSKPCWSASAAIKAR